MSARPPIDPVALTEAAGPPDAVTRTATYPPAGDGGAGEPGPAAAGDDGRYRLGDELARGSMGRIVRAVDRRLGRDVAIKLMIGSSPQLAARFEREAQVIARLQHPGIVPIHDIGRTDDGRPFYTMKLVEGRTLHDAVLAASPDERMALLPHVLAAVDAIAYAHSQRIIHRDLKPLNVLVGAFGETLVIDWGLATSVADARGTPGSTDAPDAESAAGEDDAFRPLTRHGQVVGTPAYMPPEQAAGKPVDERADVYALGAMLYHVLAGAPPYAGSDPRRILVQVAEQRPTPIDELRPDLPDDLLAIVDKAMARDPADRYPSAQEMATDLRRHQAGQLVSAHRYTLGQRIGRFIRRNRDAVIASTLVASALAFFLVMLYRELRVERDDAVTARDGARIQRDAAEALAGYMVTDLRGILEPLGKLALMQGIGRRVDDYYQAVPDPYHGGALGQRARAVELRGDAARAGGDSRTGLALYRQAAHLALAAADLEAAGQAWMSIGDSLLEQGDVDGAAHAFATARELAARSSPRAAATARLRMGMVAEARGDHDAALAAWRLAATELEEASRAQPDDLDLIYNVAVAHGMLGDLLYQQNHTDEALQALGRSRQVMERLVAAEPDNPRWLRGLSLPIDRIGAIHLWYRRLDQAEAAFRAGHAISEKVAAGDPDNADWQADLTVSLRNLGNLASLRQQWDEALDHYRRALEIADRLGKADPDNVDRQVERSSILRRMVSVLDSAGRDQEALATARRNLDERRAIVARAPADVWKRSMVADSLVDLGELPATDARVAMAALREAREIIAPLVAEDESIGMWRVTLAQAELGIARLLRRQGRVAEARAQAARALPILEALRAADELEPHQLSMVDEARTMAR